MRKIITLLLVVFSIHSYAQDTLKLRVDNPQPRVGDEVELTFNVDFLTDELKKQMTDGVELTKSKSHFGNEASDFKRVLEFKKSGKYTIGPFEFEFNGKKIVTDSIVINVAEKLPFVEGVWVRYYESDGKKYIVVEQLIENKSDYKKSKNGYTLTVGGTKSDRDKFAEIVENPEKGISINRVYSTTKTITKPGAEIGEAGLSYSFIKYEVDIDEDFEDIFTLTKKYFENLPRKAKIESIEIENLD